MALRNVELYEALKKDLSEEAAKMIAEVVPAADDLATRVDLANLRAEMHQEFSRMRRWFLTLVVSLSLGFLAMLGTLVAILTRV